MSDKGNLPTYSRPTITWLVNGKKHDRVERLYTDAEGKLGVQCYRECCCRRN